MGKECMPNVIEVNDKDEWHLIFGTVLQYLLIPTHVHVGLEVKVMTEPPRTDLLLKRATKRWTPQQLIWLPDGIRDTLAQYIMLEFKYTQSIDTDGILQAVNNRRLYLQSHKDVKSDDFKCFLVSAKQPQASTLEKYDFYEVKAGVYNSKNLLISPVTLISINELPNTKHNALIRCFASQKKHQKKAFEQLDLIKLHNFSEALYWVIIGLRIMLFGREKMSTNELHLTPEAVMRLGQLWEKSFLDCVPVEKRLEGLDAETVLQHVDAETLLKHLGTETVLQHVDTETLLKHLGAETVIQHYAPEERLQGLSVEQIEAYLQKIKKH